MSNLHESLLNDLDEPLSNISEVVDEDQDNSIFFEENDFSENAQDQEITEQCLSYAIPILKILIFIPGKLIRFLFQIGDFYYLLQILSITFEYITIILVACSGFPLLLQILYIFIAFLFSCLMGNLLTIPMWELVQLRWIKNKNPLQTFFDIFNLSEIFKNYHDRTLLFIDKITNFICSVFFYLYLFCIIDYLHSTGELFNRMNSIFLLFAPAIKFFIIYVSYVVKETIIFFKSRQTQQEEQNEVLSLMSQSSSNDPFVISMIRMVDLFKKDSDENEEKNCKRQNRMFVFFIFKIVIISLQFIFLIYFFFYYKINAGGVAFCLFVFVFISWFSLFISIPIWFFNLFHMWKYCNFIKTKQGTKLIKKMVHQFKGFKNVSFVCQMLPFMIVLILFLFFCTGIPNKDQSYFTKIENEVNWSGEITNKYPYISPILDVKSSMCFTLIHGLNLMQITSIAAAPYYEDLDQYKKFMKNSFFRDSEYDFNLSFVRKDDNHAVLLRADFDNNQSNQKVTIFSVRGTQTSNDWWLDIEIFVASAILTVAKWIPFMQKQEGYTVRVVTNFMTLPLSLLAKATLTYRYTSEMFDPIDKFLKDPLNANTSVLFTGHSLGGGLSKVLAVKYEIQSVAVSGPGITPVENKFRNSDNYDHYFKSKLIDIVPDRDLVPRFELSGGTRHRVLCKKNLGECHNVLRTMCQMGLMCNDEYHVGDFCSHAFTTEDYDQMKELANI